MRLLHREGATEEGQLVLPADFEPTETSCGGWILRRRGFRFMPCPRPSRQAISRIMSENRKELFGHGNFLAGRRSHSLDCRDSLGRFPPPVCLDGCWRGQLIAAPGAARLKLAD